LPLVWSLARGYAGAGEPLDDLVQVGSIGLIKAVDGFDPARGATLGSYAVPSILGEIRHHLRDRAAPVRVPRAVRAAGTQVQFQPLQALDPERLASPGDPLARAEDRVALARAFRALDPRERRLIGLCFFGDLSQASAAAALHLSEAHASRVRQRALAKLRAQFRDASPNGPIELSAHRDAA
jgi:RNA polymerase sigma-B factor